jgi:phenylacetate-coenzyme A ligase PaaK-like adenylate-forming protein
MAHFDDWVTDPQLRREEIEAFVRDPRRVAEPWLSRYAVWTSSGTSGVPGIYVQDPEALAIYAALLSVRFEFGPMVPDPWQLATGRSRMALVAATGGHFAGVVWWLRQCRLHPVLAAHTRVFSILQPLDELVGRLNEWQPAYLGSYPTMLALLAREQRAGRLRLRPRALWSGGEVLTAADRHEIGEAFGCQVLEDYGASECMQIAFGCRHGRLHLNDDWVVLEPVDAHGHPVRAGQPSHTVLLTNLANRVQPLIRYDLGDSVTMGTTPCPCGNRRPTLSVQGRRDDVLLLEAGGAEPLRVLPLAIETVIEEEAGIHRFQLIQTAPDALCLRVDLPGARRAAKVLARFLKAQGAANVKVAVEDCAPEVNPVSGKLCRIRALAGRRSG